LGPISTSPAGRRGAPATTSPPASANWVRPARARDGSTARCTTPRWAIRVKDGHFARKYRRIKARSGHKKAIGAVKHAILIALYHMLKNGELYRPPTPNPEAERRAQERVAKRLIAQLEKLGHTVTLQTATSTAPAAVAA